MNISTRFHKKTAIGALAACAVVGGISPVWASAGTHHDVQPATSSSTSAGSLDSANIASLRLEVSRLRAALQAERAEFQAVNRAERAAERSAARSQADAVASRKAMIDAKAAKTRDIVVTRTVSDQTKGTDPATGSPCHHGDGPSAWSHHGGDPSDWAHHPGGHRGFGH